MHDYDQQKWFDVYRTALLELKRVAMTGRIGDARDEQYPGLHTQEYHAIQGALRDLRVLEQEEARLAIEHKKRILQQSVEKLQSIAPGFERPIQL